MFVINDIPMRFVDITYSCTERDSKKTEKIRMGQRKKRIRRRKTKNKRQMKRMRKRRLTQSLQMMWPSHHG